MKLIKIYCEGERDRVILEEIVRKLMIKTKTDFSVRIITSGGIMNLLKSLSHEEDNAHVIAIIDNDFQDNLSKEIKNLSETFLIIITEPNLEHDWLNIFNNIHKDNSPSEYWMNVNKIMSNINFNDLIKKSSSFKIFYNYLMENFNK